MSDKNKNNDDDVSCAMYAVVFGVIAYLAVGFIWSFTAANIIFGILGALLIAGIAYIIVLKIRAKRAELEAAQQLLNKTKQQTSDVKASESTISSGLHTPEISKPVQEAPYVSDSFVPEISLNRPHTPRYISHDLKGNRIDRFVNNYVVIDVETSGLSYINSEITELSAIKVVNDEEIDTFTSLVKPKEPIPAAATAVNGITNDMVADAPAIEEVLPKYLDFIGENIVIGHNVNFDIDFIYESSVRILNKPFSNNYSDTLPLAHQYVFGVENFKLGTLAAHFRIFESDPHRSLSDCRTTNAIYRELRNLQLIEKMLKRVRRGKIKISDDNIFCKKAIASKGMFKSFSVPEFNSLCNSASANILEKASADADYLVLGDKVYKNYVHGETSKELEKILSAAGDKISVLSENEFLRNLLPYLK